MPELLNHVYAGRGHADRGLMALVSPDRLRRILAHMLDENEFLSHYGLRAVSRYGVPAVMEQKTTIRRQCCRLVTFG